MLLSATRKLTLKVCFFRFNYLLLLLLSSTLLLLLLLFYIIINKFILRKSLKSFHHSLVLYCFIFFSTNILYSYPIFPCESDLESVEFYNRGIEFHISEGKFSIAAKLYQEMGEMLADEDKEAAKLYYSKAADAFDNDNQTSRSNTCLLKVGEFAAQLEAYDEAIAAFKQVATRALGNNLLKYSAKDYLLKCGICYIANSVCFPLSFPFLSFPFLSSLFFSPFLFPIPLFACVLLSLFKGKDNFKFCLKVDIFISYKHNPKR